MQFFVTGNTATVVLSGVTYTATKGTELFTSVCALVISGEATDDAMRRLFEKPKKEPAEVEKKAEPAPKAEPASLFLAFRAFYEQTSGTSWEAGVGDVVLGNAFERRLSSLQGTELGWTPLVHWLTKLAKNPRAAVRATLCQFIDAKHMTISPEGDLYGYKAVNSNGTDLHSGRVQYVLNKLTEVSWSEVDQDANHPCSQGLHVGTWGYVQSTYGNKLVFLCRVSPEDVGAVPNEYSFGKLRARAILPVSVVVAPLPEGTYFVPTATADEAVVPLPPLVAEKKATPEVVSLPLAKAQVEAEREVAAAVIAAMPLPAALPGTTAQQTTLAEVFGRFVQGQTIDQLRPLVDGVQPKKVTKTRLLALLEEQVKTDAHRVQVLLNTGATALLREWMQNSPEWTGLSLDSLRKLASRVLLISGASKLVGGRLALIWSMSSVLDNADLVPSSSS